MHVLWLKMENDAGKGMKHGLIMAKIIKQVSENWTDHGFTEKQTGMFQYCWCKLIL
jgi:hypothetical protein